MNDKAIDIEPAPGHQQQPQGSMALQTSQAGAVGHAMGVNELKANLDFIRDVMRNVMKEGQDYGKIPGIDRPTLLQPGAQKLLMTFQLTEYVKKEVLHEYPGWHREYEFTVTVKSQTGREWDGVGTCSTLEEKYRYRKAGRKCPECGSPTILESRKGPPGYFCWAKKGGCGAKFDLDDPRIVNQSTAKAENPNPADTWNTVRKMAFKRALVAAAINATNTSELWTQDLEEKLPDPAEEEGSEAQNAPGRAGRSQHRPSTPKAAATPRAATPSHKVVPYADANSRGKLLRQFADLDIAKEFFIKLGWLLSKGETVEDLPLQCVPITAKQNAALLECFKNFENGGDLVQPYRPNPINPALGQAGSSPAPTPAAAVKPRDPEWWRDIICPIPPRGERRDDYLTDPDTVGDLYEARHDPDGAKRLFGFIAHFEVKKSWTGNDGQERPNTPAQIAIDTQFREALDACAADYAEKHKGDTEGGQTEIGKSVQREVAAEAADHAAQQEEDDVPF